MSFGKGEAGPLLSRGLAAAQSNDPNDREEAIFYLEWVTRTKPEPDQEVQAWYWLSRLTDDPVRKRDCLENALALRPSHPDARRDLAILEGRLKPEEIRPDPTQSGVPIDLSGQIAAGNVTSFPCPKCGAKLHYEPSMGVVRCQHCGAQADAEGNLVGSGDNTPAILPGTVSDQDWVAAIYTDQGHRWALPGESIIKCTWCGASVTLAPAVVSGKCPYCGSPQLLKVAAASMGELREPDGIVPFAVGRTGVQDSMRGWLAGQSKQMGVPADLADLAALVSGIPIYTPFWSFDISGNLGWSGYVRADADIAGMSASDLGAAFLLGGAVGLLVAGAHDMAAQSAAKALDNRYGGANMVYSTGSAAVIMLNSLVPASASLPKQQLEKLSYDTKLAVPYRQEMLANWPAELYSVSMADASLVAREHATKQGDKEIEIQTGGAADPSLLRVDRTGLSVMSYKLLLLPVWVVMYTYRGQAYRALINGQNGSVEGDVPRKR